MITTPLEDAKRLKRFEKLDDLLPEFRSTIQGLNKDELDAKISEIAKAEEMSKMAQRNDPDITQVKEKLSHLLEPYRDDSKAHKLMLEFMAYQAESKGWL